MQDYEIFVKILNELETKPEPFQSKTHREGSYGGENVENSKAREASVTYENYMSRLSKISHSKAPLPNYEPTRFSDKSYGVIKGFAVCTNQGLVRNYNEDRVAIVLNILRPNSKPLNEYWPNCSFFGVYDGHGGNKCAEFLRNNLHQYVNKQSHVVEVNNLCALKVIRSQFFPWNPQEALREAFEEVDATYLDIAEKDLNEAGNHDRSGSCAIVALTVGEELILFKI